jgi:hypothetical protein
MAVLQERDAGTTGAVGRRVFIKGLAATGALVGGLAAAGPAPAGQDAVASAGRRRPTPFSQGWTSQPGLFVDDVSLPDGFTYDLVASYRDPIGGGETFGYNNDFIAYFPLKEHAHYQDHGIPEGDQVGRHGNARAPLLSFHSWGDARCAVKPQVTALRFCHPDSENSK